MPGGTLTLPYGPVTFTQTGGTTPITWTRDDRARCRPGCCSTATTGVLSGTPTAAGPVHVHRHRHRCQCLHRRRAAVAERPQRARTRRRRSSPGRRSRCSRMPARRRSSAGRPASVPGPPKRPGQVVTLRRHRQHQRGALQRPRRRCRRRASLTFTPAANATGSATITLVAQDTGGTALGGVDTSAPQSFTITVTRRQRCAELRQGPRSDVARECRRADRRRLGDRDQRRARPMKPRRP